MTTKKRGGARPGSGPKPRTDGRTLRIVKVALTDEEHADLMARGGKKKTDARRIALLGYDVAKLTIIKALSALETNPITGYLTALTVLKIGLERLAEKENIANLDK